MERSKNQSNHTMHRYFIYCRKSAEDDDHQAISLESQHRELIRFARNHDLSVADVLFEKRSARRPGRLIFNQLLQRVGKGEANGILAWHPNRLARNAVDGGQIIHLLDIGRLLDLRFPTFTFENSPQGKFMLMIMFGHSKYEVDTLSEHVKRGNRTKRELGWYPGPAPLGYLNVRSDSGVKIIGRDPERFSVVKKLWEVFLAGGCSGGDLLMIATSQFGLRSRRTWRTGGKLLSKSALYRMFRNPFYTGHIVFEGRWYSANHEPMITVEEFNRAQKLLRGMRARSHRFRFKYSGLLRCGNCGASVVGDQKINRYGFRYVYYHCTHGRSAAPCREKVIEERELERQIIAFFEDDNHSSSLMNSESVRQLLALRASKISLKDKRVRIELKVPQPNQSFQKFDSP
jgi:site-specific DNA recombinase